MKEMRLLLMAALLLIGSGRMMADWDQYPTYSEYESIMFGFATDHPDKCEIITLGTLPSGRQLLVAHLNNRTGVGKPKFLYASTIHGDETTGWMLLLRLIDYLLENPEEPEVQTVMDNLDLYFCPNINPDGTYRGGENTVNGAQRENAQGIDMDRNYPDPHQGPHPDGNPYAPETEWMMALAQQQHFTMAAIFHGGAEVIRYPWDNTYTLHADDAWFQLISHEYADLTHVESPSYMTDYNNGVTNGAQWYMIGGGLQDYLNGYAQCRAISIHCSNTKLPSPSQMPSFWYRNKNSLFALMNQCLYGIHGTVIDPTTSSLLEGATITLVNHDDQYSTVSTYSDDAVFHRPVKGGTYTLRVTKRGYEPYETQVTVADYETVDVNVELTPLEGIVADFTADKTILAFGEEVHFTDESWGGQLISWNWTFTGGTPDTSTDQNPTVTYNEPGTYDVHLTVTNEEGETATITKKGYVKVANTLKMHEGTVSVNNALFCDDGGPESNYSNNQDVTLTIYPATADGIIMVTFQSFLTEQGWDYLDIYDGTTINAPRVGVFTGGNNPGMLSATNPDGALTFHFHSDYGVNESGWEAYVETLGLPGNPPTSIARVHSDTTATTPAWFTLDGRRLAKKPTAKGVYLYNGRKFIID